MKLEGEIFSRHKDEIRDLYRTELGEEPVAGLTYFGIFDESETEEVLQAVASIKNYMGSWYLRGCVVKPEFRGQSLQKQITLELLEYLADKTQIVRVSVFPENIYSKRNIEAVGFEFEKQKKLENGETVLVYKMDLSKQFSPTVS